MQETAQTPLLAQYERIKAQYKEAILFFRLGDFYEMFYDDAIVVSQLLNLTLTKRQSAPMCGIPWHASRAYIARLLKLGKKIAICEQLTEPGKGKGIIERGVTEILSPGTVLEDEYLDASADSYVTALGTFTIQGVQIFTLAWIAAASGEFYAGSIPAAQKHVLFQELERIAPKELIIRESSLDDPVIAAYLVDKPDILLNRYPDWIFDIHPGFEVLTKHFNTISLTGFGFSDQDPAIAAAGMVLQYLKDAIKNNLSHIKSLKNFKSYDYLAIDEAAQKNLEIVRNLHDSTVNYSLFEVVNFTKTAIGSRELRKRLLQPLTAIDAIEKRLDFVELFYKNQLLLKDIRILLGSMLDLERLTARLSTKKATPRDVVGIRETLRQCINAQKILQKNNTPVENQLFSDNSMLCDGQLILDKLDKALLDEPAISCTDGKVIRDGYCSELDALRKLHDSAREVLAAYLEQERKQTGIQSLKLRYNRMMGYFLETTRLAAKDVPEHFKRRQSLTNAERFTTEQLSHLEVEIASASEKSIEREKSLFTDLVEWLIDYLPLVRLLASKIAALDVAASSAYCALQRGYIKPELCIEPKIEIISGRHPVVEAHLAHGNFVPNDCRLDTSSHYFYLLTGPNMAGKSTYLRQNALITIMAQSGLFVPADRAVIGICDKIFCRVGAQDNLARGESTFLLEMHETAGILNNATARSLVIMDEVGRGTGTLDGLSIAWAVAEYLLDTVHCRTLFATHFHELTQLAHKGLANYSMSVEETNETIVFLKRIKQGPATGSYGIHVARLAGLPHSVLKRASELKRILDTRENELPLEAISEKKKPTNHGLLFSKEELAAQTIRSIDINSITPLDALGLLVSLKKEIE